MKKLILFAFMTALFFAGFANAGVGKVATYPARHPKKTVHHVVHAVKKAVW